MKTYIVLALALIYTVCATGSVEKTTNGQPEVHVGGTNVQVDNKNQLEATTSMVPVKDVNNKPILPVLMEQEMQQVATETVEQNSDKASDPTKLMVQTPTHVQQVVTQVSQHIPDVINQHIAQKRLARSPSYPKPSYPKPSYPKPPAKKCDYKCNRYDKSVCGFNGRCYREFENQCSLSKYNCLYNRKTFKLVDKACCEDTTTTKCYKGDM